MGGQRLFRLLRRQRCGQGRAGNGRRGQIYRRNVQQAHAVVDTLVTSTVQQQLAAHADSRRQHREDALGGAAGEKERVPGACGLGAEQLCVTNGTIAGIEVPGGRQFGKVDGGDVVKQSVQAALMSGHMHPQRIAAAQLHQRVIKRCGHSTSKRIRIAVSYHDLKIAARETENRRNMTPGHKLYGKY